MGSSRRAEGTPVVSPLPSSDPFPSRLRSLTARPLLAACCSMKWKRDVKRLVVCRSDSSGFTLRRRARLTNENNRSPSSAAISSAGLRRRAGVADGLAKFSDFFIHFGEYVGRSPAVLRANRIQRARPEPGFDRRVARPASAWGMSWRRDSGFPGVLALGTFDVFPTMEHLVGIEGRLGGGGIAEDMRMTAYQLVPQLLHHLVDGKGALFRADLAMKQHLQEHVPQLFLQFAKIAPIDGVQRFVGFLDQVGLQGFVRLLLIPWATPRAPEAAP